MNTSDVLNKAADHVQCYGHHKGDWFADWTQSGISPACIHGAISATRVAGAVKVIRDSARAAVRRYLGTCNIIGWNDAPDRTADEVIATLRACAVIEAARESADAREQVSA